MKLQTPCPTCAGMKDQRSVQCRECRDRPEAVSRTCTKCKKAKPLDQFRIRTRKTPRPRSVCMKCEAAYTRSLRQSLPIEERRRRKVLASAKEKLSPKYRARLLRTSIKLLGLDSEKDLILAALEKQKVCAICHNAPRGRLRIDHNHSTGKYRGLLCDNCNIGLGHFKDSPELLRKAIRYLKERT
jgi:hypothetical protein